MMQYLANLQSSPNCQVTESRRTRHFLILDFTLRDHFTSRTNQLAGTENGSRNITTKVYVCLFTCASARAVHRGLTAQDFLLAFRRFANRRGLPATIQSDNAKTFRSLSKEIRNITRSPEISSYLVNNQISWNFIVERAPWWGDYWERLVRSVKAPLHKVIGRTSLSYDELNTLLTEVEGVINARPPTYESLFLIL